MHLPSDLRRGGRSRPRRLVALVVAPLLGVSLIAAVPSTATTTDGADQTAVPSAAPDADFAALPGNAEPTAVTLITGDTVYWQDAGDEGGRVVEIEEAPRDVPVYFTQSGTQEDFYVIPDDVMDHVASGALDMELFNIPRLVGQGLDDESTGGELPVIVTFDDAADSAELERNANALPAASEAQGIEGIRAAGVSIDRGRAEKFRDTVFGKTDRGRGTGVQSKALPDDIESIRLDRMLEIDLSESVPQIGAPRVWDAGYTGEGVTVAVLDTGVDATHLDLVGKVVAEENFTDEPDASDSHGHGTHVASTIAGTGAASDGSRRGVAPDGDLISGKVCFNDDGDGKCPASAIMAGMEWAAAQGVDVVNMSLGGDPTDGSDPLSQLLNELSAETGTLFVTSAGNSGSFLRTVGSPAAADAALAVGAVDKSDQMAGFSSRGPRLGDGGFKPEISAPGVGIVAARATGTSLGNPVDDHYTSVDGTSMAAPHVAGAAALLAQARPELTGSELKDVLVSTASDQGHRPFDEGTGRVDVPAALDIPVFADGVVNFGVVEGTAQRELVYTNRSDEEVTLSLNASAVEATGGGSVPFDGVGLSTDTLTVPAHDQAAVTVFVSLDADVSARQSFAGVVTATGPGVALRSGIGFGPAEPTHTVTVEVLDSHGNRAGTTARTGESNVTAQHDTFEWDVCCGGSASPISGFTSGGVITGEVVTGTYTVFARVTERDPATGEFLRVSAMVDLEVEVESDMTITLDARDAVRVEPPTVPDQVDVRSSAIELTRQYAGSRLALTYVLADQNLIPVYVTPTPAGELAPMWLSGRWLLAQPQPLKDVPGQWRDCEGYGQVRTDACSSPKPDYIYDVPLLFTDGVPDRIHEILTRKDLVMIPTRYHYENPDALVMYESDSFFNHPPSRSGIGIVRMRFEPGAITRYVRADDRFWSISWANLEYRDPESNREYRWDQASLDRFGAAEGGTTRTAEDWFEAPIRLGMADHREEPLRIDWCRPGCRPFHLEGVANPGGFRGHIDGNEFGVPNSVMDGTRGHDASFAADYRMWNLDTGTELQPSGRRRFPLAADAATYRLAHGTGVWGCPECDVREGLLGPLVQTGWPTTTWTFTSKPLSPDARVPHGYNCPGPDRDPGINPWELVCEFQPLIQLEYKLGLDINNRAPAGRAHVFTVTAGHHTRAVDRAKVTDVSVQASFDDGETWTDARVIGKPKDAWDTGGFLPSAEPYQKFRVVLKIPPLHRTNGFVTLRVRAEDSNGGTVEQIIERAYILKQPRSQGANGPS